MKKTWPAAAKRASQVSCPIGALQNSLEAFFEIVARQHDTVLAGEAPQADVGADAGDLPIGSAAGMGFSHANDVADVDVNRHLQPPGAIIPAEFGMGNSVGR